MEELMMNGKETERKLTNIRMPPVKTVQISAEI
jgi:hypothetical protein